MFVHARAKNEKYANYHVKPPILVRDPTEISNGVYEKQNGQPQGKSIAFDGDVFYADEMP